MHIRLKLTISFIYYLTNFVFPDVISICNMLSDIFFTFHVARNYVFPAFRYIDQSRIEIFGRAELLSF